MNYIERDTQGNLIINGWVVEKTDECTCATDPVRGQHHPYCGFEPIGPYMKETDGTAPE